MKSKNNCHTYFKIIGDFNPSEISSILHLKPYQSWTKKDLRRDGKPFGFDLWEFGYENEYDPYVYTQMEKTVEELEKKVDALNYIHEHFDVQFYLVVVPHVYAGGINPVLAPSMRIIDFCHATRTKIDIDLYVYNEDD